MEEISTEHADRARAAMPRALGFMGLLAKSWDGLLHHLVFARWSPSSSLGQEAESGGGI
jgi:hypothetical protein